MARRQGVYWGPNTKPWVNDMDMEVFYELNKVGEDHQGFIRYLKGQKEVSPTGYVHWQFFLVVEGKKSLNQMRQLDSQVSWRLSRSEAAESYVWKDDTKVCGSEFEYGKKPFKLNSKTDWQQVWDLCTTGKMDEIDPGIKIRCWYNLNSIANSVVKPVRRPNVLVDYYYGATGTGKSHTADNKYPDAYWKISSNKWWDNYKGEDTVIIDELNIECISITKLLTWFDKYKCYVEIKGGTIGLAATKFIITSNLSLDELLVNEKEAHKEAFRRRVNVKHFLIKFIH